MKNNKHGGKRPGAGRKSTGRSERKTLFLSPTCVNYINQFDNPSEFVEQVLRNWISNNKIGFVNKKKEEKRKNQISID